MDNLIRLFRPIGSHQRGVSQIHNTTHYYQGWDYTEIPSLIITNFKSIDNWLKSVEIIWPFKSISTESASHLTIKKASCQIPYCTLFAVACLKRMSLAIHIVKRIFNINWSTIPVLIVTLYRMTHNVCYIMKI